MSDLAAMNIVIGAQVDGATNGLNKVSTELGKTALAAQKVDSSIAKSSQSFQNWGRVIQDLPFGFQGIQNNLTQLIPATGALGLAFSALIAAITFAQVGLTFWTRGLKAAKEEEDKFSKSLDEAKSKASATGFQLQSLSNIAKDSLLPLSQRNEALKEANKILGEHGEKLTLANIATAEGTKVINDYTNALIAQAVAQKYQERVADLIVRQTELVREKAKAQEELFGSNKKIDASAISTVLVLKDQISAQAKLISASKELDEVTRQLNETRIDANSALFTSTKLLGDLGTKTKQTGDTIAKILADLDKATAKDLSLQRIFGFDKTAQSIISDILNAVDRLTKIGVKPEDTIMQKLIGRVEDLQHQLDAGKINERLHKLSQELSPVDIPINFAIPKVKAKPMDFGLADPVEALKKQIEANAATIQDTIINSIEAIGQGIGEAVAGAKNPLAPLLNVIAAGLKQLGEHLIEFGAIQKLIKVALGPNGIVNPFLAIGAGIALEALAAIIQKGATAFASGGIVTRPTLALVGEQGPERITPLNQITNSSSIIQGEVIFSISGQNLRGILKRADQTSSFIN